MPKGPRLPSAGNILLHSALESIDEGVAVSDADGRLLAFNAAAARTFDKRNLHKPPVAWPKTFGLYLSDQKTLFPWRELPILRAVRGENTDQLEMFVRNAKVPEGCWISVTGRPVRDRRGTLIGGVAVFRDITERKRAEHQVAEVLGREQRRIGQDLHDGLCQTLLAAQFTSRVMAQKLKEGNVPGAHECLSEVKEHIRNSLAQADMLARGLFPVELETRGLMAALEELARNMSRMYRIDCRFVCPRPVQVRRAETATHLYRIAQEAVSNARKGGKAQRIVIRLDQRRDGVRLGITDNGVGISTRRRRRGMGLSLMHYRARLISARLAIRRRPRGGTQVVCVAPPG